MIIQKFWGSIFIMLFLLNCGGTKSSSRDSWEAFYFGHSTTVESLRQIHKMTLLKFNHDLKVVENFLETEWRYIPPAEQEELQGIKAIRYKLIVDFRQRKRRNLFTAHLKLYYDARYETGEWEKTNPRQETVEMIKTMQNEVKHYLKRYISQW